MHSTRTLCADAGLRAMLARATAADKPPTMRVKGAEQNVLRNGERVPEVNVGRVVDKCACRLWWGQRKKPVCSRPSDCTNSWSAISGGLTPGQSSQD